MLLIQYLEDSPDLIAMSSTEVRARLRAAFEILPISIVILGWNVPEALLQTCADECERAEAQLYHWHPLLTGNSAFLPRPDWQVIGLSGERVPGFNHRAEFTFLCPNNPAASDAALEHLWQSIRNGPYHGVFLDRMRYPSPAADPCNSLACFCEGCQRAARIEGLDLLAARQKIQRLLATPQHGRFFLQQLLDPSQGMASDPDFGLLSEFLEFRTRSIARFVRSSAEVARREDLAVGLDCFSPALTHMVGQDLAALNTCCNWIKIMTYGHTLGPAGLPFELLGLAGWLIGQWRVPEREALRWLAQVTRLPLPTTLDDLQEQGLPPSALVEEVRRARSAGVTRLLAGIELVDLAGVIRLKRNQVGADLDALRVANPDGLVLSWDLRWMPLERLEIVREIWLLPNIGFAAI